MKTIGIISDTHSWWDPRYAKHFADCDEVWHAGDVGCEQVLERLQQLVPVVRAVYGNADGQQMRLHWPETTTFTTEGVKVMMTHIGGYPGKYAPGIRQELLLTRPKIFVCGHSHILKVIPDRMLGLLTINPGAAGRQGWQRERTLVKLTLDAGKIAGCQVIELGDDSKNLLGMKLG